MTILVLLLARCLLLWTRHPRWRLGPVTQSGGPWASQGGTGGVFGMPKPNSIHRHRKGTKLEI